MTIADQIDGRLKQTIVGDESLLHKFYDAAGDLAVNLVVAAIILALTLWASRWLSGLVRRAMGRLHGRSAPDLTLQGFVASMVRYTILAMGFVAVLQQLGVKATSIVAVLTAASLAIGLAVQGALSNIAAGVMILLFRPYRVGDIIETGGRKGIVRSLDLVLTELATEDNLRIVVPNSKVFGDVIVNHSTHAQRRVDVALRLPGAADAGAVMDGVLKRARENPKVLDSPEPQAHISLLTEAAVEITVQAWARGSDHGVVHSDLMLTARLIAAGKGDTLPPLPEPEISPAPATGPKSGRRSLRSRPKA